MFELMEDPPLLDGEQEPETADQESARVDLRHTLEMAAFLLGGFDPHIRAVYVHHLAKLAEDGESAEVRSWLATLLRHEES